MLVFCNKHNITCRIYKDAVEKGNELDCYISANSKVQVNFFVCDDHCFWYGKPLKEKGICREPEANNGIANMWKYPKRSDGADSDHDDDNLKYLIEKYCDKETMAFFRKADKTPPFAE